MSIAAVSPAHSLMIDSNGNVLNTNSNITFANVKVVGSLVGNGGGLTNLNGSDITSGTVSSVALSSDVRQQLALAGSTNSILNDVDAVAYATRTGVSDLDSLSRVNSFIISLKAAGLWNFMDGYLFRTNFNNGLLRSLRGQYGSVHGAMTQDGAGLHSDGYTGYAVLPLSINPSNTLVVLYASDMVQNPTSGIVQTPFGLFNTNSSTAGAIYPTSNGNPHHSMRWNISGNGGSAISDASTGWFQYPGTGPDRKSVV